MSTSYWDTPKLLWVFADSQRGICCSWLSTNSTFIRRGELINVGRAVEHSTPSTEDAAACLPQRCSSKPTRAHRTHWRVYFISSALQRPCKVCSSCLVLLTQRPPKCTSYQNHDFKAAEKRVSKHLKAQMEADNFPQSCRKCHFTIPKSVEVMTLTLTAEFHFQPS